MFTTIKSKLKEIGEKITDDAAKIGGKFTSIDPNDIVDPGNKFGPLWEKNENVDSCRECGVRFQHLIKRKHHCRSCAGVFCDECCPVMEAEGSEDKRVCLGCFRGEMVQDKLKLLIKQQLELEQGTGEELTFVDKVMDKAAAKVTETLRLPSSASPGSSSGVHVALIYGSAFPEDTNTSSTSSSRAQKSLPDSGYFEFHNKCSVFCCIKILKKGVVTKFEIPRPSYRAVPPLGYIHGFLDPDETGYELFLLYDNQYGTPPPNQVVQYDTRARNMTKHKISSCAKVEEFSKITVYSINSRSHNVLLKYKGKDDVQVRHGDGMGRVGFLGKMQGKRAVAHGIDYATNIEDAAISVICTHAV